MTQTFTQDDLVRYLYKETSEAENKEIAKALLCDTELLEIYKELALVKRKLSEAAKSPSERVINNILQYSKSYYLHSV